MFLGPACLAQERYAATKRKDLATNISELHVGNNLKAMVPNNRTPQMLVAHPLEPLFLIPEGAYGEPIACANYQGF